MTRRRRDVLTVEEVQQQLVRARAELDRLDSERGFLMDIVRGFEAWFRLAGRSVYEIVPFGYWDAAAASAMAEAARIRALPPTHSTARHQ